MNHKIQYLISVIIPTYNRASSLKKAILSVLNQTYSASEIIVIDDGSNDNTCLLKNEFPMIQWIKIENSGVSKARNIGISQAKHPWIALLDSDDQWHPKKLEKQIEFLTQNSDIRICHTNEIWIRNGMRVNPKKKHQKFGGAIFEKCLPLCVISPSSVLLQKQLLIENNLFDENLPACEDYDLWLKISSRYPVGYIDLPLTIKYGGHIDQLSRKVAKLDYFRIYALEKYVNTPSFDLYKEYALIELALKAAVYARGCISYLKFNESKMILKKTSIYLKELEKSFHEHA